MTQQTTTDAPPKPKTLAELLAEGRRILAAKKAESDARVAEERRKCLAIFNGAHDFASGLFPADTLAEPIYPPETWNPADSEGHNLTFSIRPFSERAGSISVHVRGYDSSAHSGECDPLDAEWTWGVGGDSRDSRDDLYHVATHWRTYDNDSDYLYPDSWHQTNDLAEALALCEQYGEQYRAASAKVAQRKAEREAKQSWQPRTMTPAERLVDALEDYIRYIRPDVED